MWTCRKSASRSHSNRKVGTREHPSDTWNDKWDTLQRPVGWDTCGGYCKSTRPYMKCVIWDRVHVVQHFTRWEWLEIRRLFQFLQSSCTNPMMTQVFHEWPESDSMTTTLNFRQIISPSLWVKHNIKHGSHLRHAHLHYYVTDSLTNAVPFTQHRCARNGVL